MGWGCVILSQCRHFLALLLHMHLPFSNFRGWVGAEGCELLICPYPLKVQACPPQDQKPALQSRVLGQEEERMRGAISNFEKGLKVHKYCNFWVDPCYL